MPRYKEPGIYPIRVEYEDVDSAKVVHHPNYLRYCERARTAFLQEIGYSYSTMLEDGIGVVIAEAQQKFLKPLFFHDEVLLVTRVAGASRSSLRLFQLIFPKATPKEVFSQSLPEFAKDPNRLFAAQIRLVAVNRKTGKPEAFPDRWREAFGFPPEGKDPIVSKSAVALNFEAI